MLRQFAVVALSLIATTSIAEQQVADQELAGMARLPPLVGVWKGEGWMRIGSGEQQRFVGQERVESRLEGHALLIEGKHWTPDRTRLVHDALAILTFDPPNKNYRFRTQVVGRGSGDYRGHMEGDAFVWEMPNPRGDIRYTIRVAQDEWIEIGEMKTGDAWQQFFQMRLKRAE
jgi:hypothetical protein